MTFRIEVIGDATLYMGDCREVMPTLQPAHLALTDPPYLVTSGGGGREAVEAAVAAIRSGRKFVGIELTQKWFDVACQRIQAAVEQPRLFEDLSAAAVQTSMFGGEAA